MLERLYTEFPEIYDAIQSEWDYDRDVTFIDRHLEDHCGEGGKLLEIGCGTGEHTCRLADMGYRVTALDKYEGMLALAREKCEADFRHATLPDIDLTDTYDAVIMIRGVVNHLSPEALEPSLRAIESHLAEGGILIFDNSPLPPNGNHPAMDIGTTDQGEYARIAHHVAIDGGLLEWRSVTFTSDGECFVNSREMTPFTDDELRDALQHVGFEVTTYDGFGPGDERTVFVALASSSRQERSIDT